MHVMTYVPVDPTLTARAQTLEVLEGVKTVVSDLVDTPGALVGMTIAGTIVLRGSEYEISFQSREGVPA